MSFGDIIQGEVLGNKPTVPQDTDPAANAIAEGAAVNTTVGITAHSTFANGNASLDYSLVADSSGGGFKIDQSSGVVTVADPSKIDFESSPGHLYTITVRATKNANFSSDQTFTISVNDVAPSTPVDSNPAPNTVLEGAANGTATGITASATDVNGGTVTWSLGGDSSGGGFTINPTTGVITVADGSKIDFESAPGHAYTVTAVASDGTLTSSQTFTINVGDVAMSTPVDTNGAANTVAEGAAAGTTVGITAQASDPSGPATTYALIGDTSGGGFTINSTTGVVTVADPSKIDFESTGPGHSHTIIVRATAGAQTTQQSFTIGVSDVAPSIPVDANAAANGVVEGAAVGTLVGVTASSSDVNGGAVTYSLTADSSGGGFAIDPISGVITVVNSAKIDYETAAGHAYTVTAQASDGQLPSSQTFTIPVADVAPSTPVDSDGATNTVVEGAAAGTPVGITASSTDVNGGAVTFSLTGDSSGGGFAINSATGVITVADPSKIDYESAAGHAYSVTARASDGTLTSSQTFSIGVTDVAPSTPADTDDAANSIDEGAANGSTVGITASSTDPNGPAASYTLTDDAGGRFTIDSSTGVVTVANGAAIDYETAAGHAYSITVRGTSGALSSTQTFSIDVNDVGPSVPDDTDGAANSVDENAANGTPVGITASSADPGGGPATTYALTDDAGGRFTIDPTTGVVTVADGSLLDFETAQSHDIVVQATAGALTNSITFTIGVNDVNDNAPVFTSSATPSVAENNTAVVALTTTDADTVGTNPANFSITGGADSGLFTITGGNQLQFIAPRDFETQAHSYAVQVTANDGVNNTVQNLTVTLTDQNDNAPVFTSSATPSVAENNTAVVALTTTDADTVGTNPATFSITGGANAALFTITGGNQLQFVSGRDFETQAHSYAVEVTANDGANNTVQNITVTLTDTNDTAPTFTSSATPSVAENSTAVVALTTTDPDTVGTNPATFSITGGANAGLFTITGGNQLQFVSGRDFETQAHSYAVQVTANDGTNNTVQNINVTLTDVNDNAPVFTSSATPSVAENNTAVVTLTTTDADTVGTNPATFTITGGANQALFTITGGNQLEFLAPRDFETQAHSYAVQVTANDGVNNTVQNITVSLTDQNDNAPVFTSSATPSVAENNTAVVALTTTDADTVGTNPATFSITGGANAALFTITGGNQLQFVSGRDFETQAHSYAVEVTANDGTNNTVQNLTVTLTDQNDNAPTFTSSATPTVYETNTAVVDLTTTDPDTVGTNPATFTITGGADQAKFTITGGNHLAFVTAPDYENPTDAGPNNVYDVQVTANDGSSNTIQNIAVTVADINDAPTLTATPTNPIYSPGVDLFNAVSVFTNDTAPQSIDQLVFTVSNVNDIDETMSIDGSPVALTNGNLVTPTAGHSMDVSVSITGTTATVTISKGGGVAASVMAGIVDTMTYTDATVSNGQAARAVTITSLHDTGGNDNGGNPTGTPNITSTVVFNQAPVIDQPANADTYATSINENTTAVTTIHATDPDTQPNPAVSYSIVGGFEDGGLFSLTPNGSSVDLAFNSAPNYENPLDTATGGSNTYIVKVRASDGASVDDQVITVTVNDVNEAPTANPDTASVQEKGGVNNGTNGNDITTGFNVITGTGTGSAADTDPDAGQTLTVVGAAAGNPGGPLSGNVNTGLSGAGSLNYGTFTIQNNGDYTYIVNQTNAAVQGLRQFSDILTDTFSYTIQDNGAGNLKATTTVTVTIHGQNDNPVANADTPTGVTEAGGTSNLTVGTDFTGFTHNVLTGAGAGDVADTDVDSGDTMTVVGIIDGNHLGSVADGNVDGPSFSANSPNDYGSITMHSDGGFNFAVNQSNAIVQALNTGQHVDAVFTYKIADTAGATSTALLTIAVNGANDAPVAQADGTYVINQNTATTINAATGVLANDSDVDNPTITAVQNVGPAHASSFTLNSDGSFSYTPTAGYLGGDSFTYHATDGSLSSSIVTVSLDVQPLIWHVDNSSVDATEDGSAAHPFHSIANFNTANAAASHKPDIVYLHYGTGTYHEADGFNLANSQTLLGQGVDLTYTTSAGAPGGAHVVMVQDNDNTLVPVVSTTGGDDIDLAQNNTVRGLTLGNTGSGIAIAGTNFGTFNVDNTVAVNTDNNGMILDTGTFGSGAAFSSFTSGGATDVSLTNVAGSVDLGTGTMAGQFAVIGGTVSTTYAGNLSQANNASMVDVSGGHSGTLTFNTGTLNATAGTGLQFANADGTYNFNGTTTLNGGDAGIDILAGGDATNGSQGTFNFGSNTSITSPTGAALNISGSSAGVTYGGTITQNNAANAVAIANEKGTHTVDINGLVTANTSTATGVNITGNSAGTTVQFDGGLNIDTTTGTGFNATGGGTIHVTATGDDESINSTGATALNLTGMTVDATGFNLDSTSSGGGAGNVNINSVTGTGAINLGSGALSGSSTGSVAFAVTAGTGSIDYNGSIAKTTDGRVIDVQSHTSGTLSFDGAVSSTNLSDGIRLTGDTSATIGFTNTLTLNTSTSNTTAFDANTGGTVTATGSGSTINSGSGTAINISSTSIGANNVIFQKVDVNGATTGINVDTTGSSGGLHITGTGSAGTGGTIQNTGQGAVFNSTKDVQLGWMNFTNANSTNGTVNNVDSSSFNSGAKAAINMSSVTGATLDHLSVTSTGGAGGVQAGINGQNVSNLALSNSTVSGYGDASNEGDVLLWNTTGTSSITNSTFGFVLGDATAGTHLVDLRNGAGTSLTLSVSGNTFKDTFDSTNGAAGLSMTTVSNATLNADIVHNAFSNLKTVGIQTFARDTSTQHVDITDAGSPGSPVAGTGNTFTPTGSNLMRAIDLSAEDTANLFFNINRNGLIKGAGGPIINVFGINTAHLEGRIDNNSDIRNGVDDSAGSPIFIHPEDASTAVVEIIGNTITNQGHDRAIFVTPHGDGAGPSTDNGTLDITISNNTITNTFNTAAGNVGIDVRAGSNNGDTTITYAKITNNTVTLTANPNDVAFLAREGSNTGQLYFDGTVTGASNSARAQNYWNANGNTPLNSTFSLDAGGAPAYASIPAGHNGGHVLTPSNATAMLSASGGVQSASGSAGEMALSQDELNAMVVAATVYWAAAGLSDAQIKQLQSVTYDVGDLTSGWLGESRPGHVTVSADADGHGWFFDTSPFDKAEFSNAASSTQFFANPTDASAGHIDLLTVLMHEMGEQLGLRDGFDPAYQSDLMFGLLADGERRIPDTINVTQIQQQAAVDIAKAAEVAVGSNAAPDGTVIVPGSAGADTFHIDQGGTIVAGGAGADTFVFGQGVLTTAAASLTHIVDYHAAEGDSFDFSALTSAFHGSSISDAMVVRAVEDVGGKFAMLQVDQIDAAVLPGAPNWVSVAQLDGAHAGDAVNVLIDNQSLHLAHIHVDLLV